jgi:hypothetical protein
MFLTGTLYSHLIWTTSLNQIFQRIQSRNLRDFIHPEHVYSGFVSPNGDTLFPVGLVILRKWSQLGCTSFFRARHRVLGEVSLNLLFWKKGSWQSASNLDHELGQPPWLVWISGSSVYILDPACDSHIYSHLGTRTDVRSVGWIYVLPSFTHSKGPVFCGGSVFSPSPAHFPVHATKVLVYLRRQPLAGICSIWSPVEWANMIAGLWKEGFQLACACKGMGQPPKSIPVPVCLLADSNEFELVMFSRWLSACTLRLEDLWWKTDICLPRSRQNRVGAIGLASGSSAHFLLALAETTVSLSFPALMLLFCYIKTAGENSSTWAFNGPTHPPSSTCRYVRLEREIS